MKWRSAIRHPYRALWLWRRRNERKRGLFTIPPWAKGFPLGTRIELKQAGQRVSVQPGENVTIQRATGYKMTGRTAGGGIILMKVASDEKTDEWILTGDLEKAGE